MCSVGGMCAWCVCVCTHMHMSRPAQRVGVLWASPSPSPSICTRHRPSCACKRSLHSLSNGPKPAGSTDSPGNTCPETGDLAAVRAPSPPAPGPAGAEQHPQVCGPLLVPGLEPFSRPAVWGLRKAPRCRCRATGLPPSLCLVFSEKSRTWNFTDPGPAACVWATVIPGSLPPRPKDAKQEGSPGGAGNPAEPAAPSLALLSV